MIDRATIGFMVFALAAGAGAFWLNGPDAFLVTLREALTLLALIIPQVALGLVLAGFATILLPNDTVARWLGGESGWRGLLLAGGLGALMPGGPFASFPVILALANAGADIGALVAFLLGWSTISLHRLAVWEIPFLGVEFGLIRLAVCLPIPILAGLLARWLNTRYRIWRAAP